jgi:hypothetical protein
MEDSVKNLRMYNSNLSWERNLVSIVESFLKEEKSENDLVKGEG